MPYARASDKCAVRARQTWTAATRGSTAVRCFDRVCRGDTLTDQRLSHQSVALIVKRRARGVGVDPAKLSGHSLRARVCPTAAAALDRLTY